MTDLLDAAPPEPETKPKKKKTTRNVLFFFLGIVVIAALVGTAFVAKLANDFNSQTQKITNVFPKEESRPAPAVNGAKNILLLGSDSRGDAVDMAEQGAASDQRSDTMMWVHIPADRKNITMMSIMRDTWVDIPGHGEAKINAAMAFGGVPLVVETLEGLFKNRIDHVAIVDFEGFKAITDSLGGVTVPVTVPFTTSTHTFNAGPQLMNGDEALAFVRERYAFTDGDYQRVRNQQLFLKAVMGTVLTPATLTNPAKISDLVGNVSPYISVDKSLDAGTLGALALSLRDVRSSNVISFTLPNLGTGTSADGQSIVVKDDAAVLGISEALTNDSLVSYLAANGLG
ncbi:LCP family protein [Arthrobacter sp. PAMC 25486]|uniref:LCP family protein n=1 Tax=Arthrobacter sp. PAMC 25486 TaxID=1494608 RepID=UPI00056FF0E7|nr:LCP family protein [Arthrobacter sp. PAMC 25486]